MLISKGKLIESHMKKAQITHDELMEAVREHGVATAKEVDLAILEVDGSISVLSNQYQKETVKRRKSHKVITKQEG
jgi:uncharacterized membrane protein YcaP (DUF421 family)